MKKNIFTWLLILLLIGTSGMAYHFYSKLNGINGTSKKSTEDIDMILDKVGRHIELPVGETPTAATITDLTALKNQPFFKNAKIGDKVVIYTKAAKAYLYDPVADKLIEVAPLNTNASTPKTVAPDPEETAGIDSN